MIPCFRHSSSSSSDKPVGCDSIPFRKTAGSSYATYNTLVWRYFTFRTTFSKRVVWSVTYLERQYLHELVQRAPPSVAPPSWKRATSETCSIHCLKINGIYDEHPEHTMNITPVWVLGFSVKDVLVSYIDDGLYFEANYLKDTFVRLCTSLCYIY